MDSRLTYHKKVKVCWQKQLRDKFIPEGSPDISGVELKDAVVRSVSRNLAKQIIYKYEWLGTMSSSSIHYGIFFGDYCAGVTCVALNGTGTAGYRVHQRFNIKRHQLATLARGA